MSVSNLLKTIETGILLIALIVDIFALEHNDKLLEKYNKKHNHDEDASKEYNDYRRNLNIVLRSNIGVMIIIFIIEMYRTIFC